MKYIRTKDGIYEIEKEDCSSYWLKNHNTLKWVAKEQFKAANTIEGLIDEYVIIVNGIQPEIFKFHGIIRRIYEQAKNMYECIYGAIWTDKGLIYVAKMNDKGELELL